MGERSSKEWHTKAKERAAKERNNKESKQKAAERHGKERTTKSGACSAKWCHHMVSHYGIRAGHHWGRMAGHEAYQKKFEKCDKCTGSNAEKAKKEKAHKAAERASKERKMKSGACSTKWCHPMVSHYGIKV